MFCRNMSLKVLIQIIDRELEMEIIFFFQNVTIEFYDILTHENRDYPVKIIQNYNIFNRFYRALQFPSISYDF